MHAKVQLFLSCVSDEFGTYRDALRHSLTRPNVEVKIQEDFKGLGGDTLRMLEEYIENCEAVVHFVGEMSGALPAANSVKGLLSRRPDLEARLAALGVARHALAALSYTQWEAWLTLYHGRDLLIVEPAPGVDRGPKFAPTDASRASQAEHLSRQKAIDYYPGPPFTNADNLVAQIFASAVIDALVKAAAAPARQPRDLPFASLGPLFMGRDKALGDLRAALAAGGGAAVVGRALHGLGGVGKTRLAIEYALRHEAEYSALLFVRADDPATLNANLAALAGPSILDLPEKEAVQDAAKIEAVMRWLDANPTWLMILDNVDDEEAVAAVTKLMSRFKGGHVIVAARAANFPASLRKLELGVLDENAAAEFLLERTRDDRALANDDADKARELAHELDGLALGLEQAAAYIAIERIGFARYLKLWHESRQKVVDWFDPALMSYAHDTGLAATWATSADRLTQKGRCLLDRLAMLAPDPIPDLLINVAVPGEAADYDALGARADLYAYSLITRATGEDGAAKGFVMHRLVQDFARRAMTEKRRGEALREALGWVDGAFAGDPSDVRSWPVLDPLAPHALAVARWADEAGIAEPTQTLLGEVGVLLSAKARFAEAEPLDRRALAIGEASLGPDHPNVAIRLSNLATLLRDTNRQDEAEPLYRRALAIDEASLGPDHPNVAIRLNNLAGVLHDKNRLGEAEPLLRRALAIDEASLEPDHPNVAIRLVNLGSLLNDTNRHGEAEPLFRRALAIDQTNYGPDHPRVAADLSNLAGLLKATNRLGEAEPLFRRARAIDETSYGPDHPNVAKRLNNLAVLLKITDRLGEAERHFRRALSIDEATYGPDSPEVAIDLSNLASLLQDSNRPREAEALYRGVLAIDGASYGPDHPNVAIHLSNLATLLYDTDRPGEAEPLVRRALAIFEKSFGTDHPNVANSLNTLAGLLEATSRHGEAESLYRRALMICENSLGTDHPSTVTVRRNVAALDARRR
jgi:tetratricopeptide (TPR) repeat protein